MEARLTKAGWKNPALALAGGLHTIAEVVSSVSPLPQKEERDNTDVLVSDTDIAQLWRKKGRYGIDVLDDHTKSVIAAKYQALTCVDALLNFVSTVRLRMLLADFKVAYLRTLGSEVKRSPFLDPSQRSVQNSIKARADVLGRYQITLQRLIRPDKKRSTEETSHVREYLHALASGSKAKTGTWVHPGWSVYDGHRSGQTEEPDPNNATLPEILLDAAQYNDYNLLTLSMECLNRIYTAEASLTAAGVQAQILVTPPSCRLARLLDGDIPWMERESKGVLSSSKMIVLFSKRLLYYASQCYLASAFSVDDLEETAEVTTDSPLGRGSSDPAWGGIAKPDGESWLENPGGDHQINQNIIYNSGMIPLVLDVIGSRGQPALVLKCCFVFMKAICRNFNKVQLSLMENLSTILSVEGRVTLADKPVIEPSTVKGSVRLSPWVVFVEQNPDRAPDLEWQDSMGQAIAEIFNGCKETCLRITEDQISLLLEFLVGYNEFAPSFLDALEAVAKVEEWNLPLKRNQELIIKVSACTSVRVRALWGANRDAPPPLPPP